MVCLGWRRALRIGETVPGYMSLDEGRAFVSGAGQTSRDSDSICWLEDQWTCDWRVVIAIAQS